LRTEDIVNKVFARSFMGYDIEQVDRFLDEVIESLERYEAEKKEMLTAMEYLLGKLEKGQKLPLAEMRKAIDSGKPAKKRALPPDCAKPEAESRPKAEKSAVPAEPEKRARAVARQASVSAPKQARPPKVQRVVKNGVEKEEPQAVQKPAKANGEDWFDELLVNLCERERQGYTPVKPEATPEATVKEPTAAPADEVPTVREIVSRPQTEQRQQPQPAEQTEFEPAAEKPVSEETGAGKEETNEGHDAPDFEELVKGWGGMNATATGQPDQPDEAERKLPFAPEQTTRPDEPEQAEFSEPEQPSGESELD
jgi:DivIVA domain-containing protein